MMTGRGEGGRPSADGNFKDGGELPGGNGSSGVVQGGRNGQGLSATDQLQA